MDVFYSLWENSDQDVQPPNDDFRLFTMQEWMTHSSTHKILSGSFRCPLPAELENGTTPSNKNPLSFTRPNASKQNSVQQINSSEAQKRAKVNQPQLLSEHREKKYIPGLVKFPVSRPSSLTKEEQRDCLRLLNKYYGKSSDGLFGNEKTEYQLFESLHRRVREEQALFLECAKSSWPDYVEECSNLKKPAALYVNQLWQHRVSCAMARYPKTYKKDRLLLMKLKTKQRVTCTFLRNLLSIGKVPFALMPTVDKPSRVATNFNVLRSWGLLNIKKNQTAGTLHKVPVSGDPNAERLARLQGANVVISSSGLKCLLDNHEKILTNQCGPTKAWKLPIHVREHRTFENGLPVTKTIVFIDKALPPASLTGPEMVGWYHKHALSAAIIHRRHDGGICFDIEGQDFSYLPEELMENSPSTTQTAVSEVQPTSIVDQIRRLEGEQEMMDSNSNSNNLIASPAIPEVQTSALNQKCELQGDDEESDSSSNSDSDDDMKLMISLPDEVIPKSHPDINFVPCVVNENECVREDNSAVEAVSSEIEQTSVKTDTHTTACEEPSENSATVENQAERKSESTSVCELFQTEEMHCYLPNKSPWSNIPPAAPVRTVGGNALPLSFTNVTYSLWSIHPDSTETNGTSVKNHEKVNVLVRCHIDGCESLGDGVYQPLCLASKQEHQLDFGAGAVSLSELTRQWAALYFRPDAILARGRVNPPTSEIVKIERRSLSDIEEEAKKLYDIDLTGKLGLLHGVLSDLLCLPVGEYLLAYNQEMGEFAELLVKSTEQETATYDLTADYKNTLTVIPCELPWQPLDTAVVLPRNTILGTMPCTFLPRRGEMTCPKMVLPVKKSYVKFASKNKKKKKKKKKVKQSNPNAMSSEVIDLDSTGS